MIVGFGDIDNSGYLDRLYVHKDYQRRGVATIICDKLEQAVKVNKIITHASITAKPFFEQRGFKVVKEHQVVRNRIALTNYVMEKQVR
ncbi:MAG: GNAT family N-acetyltransferase [Clostridia bacterium]|nr:GNAT family N-acetyltransferase [Clostridia bacterium]